MPDLKKDREIPLNESKEQKKEQKQKSGYGGWLFRKEGTAAEPWPTGEDLWNDPEVQNEMKRVRDAFNHTKKQNN